MFTIMLLLNRKAKETYVKMRKERDFHRMHHKRVVQEKNKLITDIKRFVMILPWINTGF